MAMYVSRIAAFAMPGDTLLAVTKDWLATPSEIHRAPFETCLETGELHHPRTPAMKSAFTQAEMSRCARLQSLPEHKLWIALDCKGYGHRPKLSDGNESAHHRFTPLSLCAPSHVAIACLSCSVQHLRPGLDMGLPPITPKSTLRLSTTPSSAQEVEQRCRAHSQDAMRLAASFRGNAKHGSPVRSHLRSHLMRTVHGATVNSYGRISVRLSDALQQGAPVTNSTSMTTDLLHSQFGLVPRGDSYFSYRFSEVLAFGIVPVVIADDWALPFDEIIDWDKASLRVRERELQHLPAMLEALPLDKVCEMRQYAFEVYRRCDGSGPRTLDVQRVAHSF